MSTGHTSVLLNNVPGDWILCRNGLRQGDALCPYLFIIIADVLQRLIRRASDEGRLAHPIDPSLPCPVLQYADDTLILCRADIPSVTHLKTLLGAFALATGLAINFHKSGFIPMHCSGELSAALAGILGCPISSFPQPYLGLPLSPHKLPISAYDPLIRSFDRYLSGWRALLLSSGGRMVLCNAVLNNLSTYFMCSYLLPSGVIEMIDRRRRSFFWTGKDTCSGARCLVAWDNVCADVQEGGFGIRDLRRQNMCLLLNFVHKLHQPDCPPWKSWFLRSIRGDIGDCSSAPSFLEVIVRRGLPTYRAITRVALGDGRTTSFWHDRWCPGGALCFEYAALFSHSTRPNASVAAVALDGLHLQTRLSSVAASQLGEVRALIRALQLGDTPDRRFMAWGEDLAFSSRAAFRVLSSNGVLCQTSIDIWCSKLPRKIKIFACLLARDRLSMRVNLFVKNCAPSSMCASCSAEETAVHIFTSCARAASTWRRLGLGPFDSVGGILSSPPAAPTSPPLWKDGLLVLLWHIWKARNNATFNGVDCDVGDILSRTADDIMLWSHRYNAPDRALFLETRAFFLSAL